MIEYALFQGLSDRKALTCHCILVEQGIISCLQGEYHLINLPRKILGLAVKWNYDGRKHGTQANVGVTVLEK